MILAEVLNQKRSDIRQKKWNYFDQKQFKISEFFACAVRRNH